MRHNTFRNGLLRIRITALSLALLCSACTNEYGDRITAIQLPLFIVLMMAPIVTIVLRKRQTVLKWVMMAMWVLYVIYETGYGSMTNIRVDLVLLLPTLFVTTLLGVYWAQRD